MVKEEMCEKVVEVRRESDRAMTVVLVIEDDVMRLACGYAPQSGRSLEEKQSLYDELKGEWDVHSADPIIPTDIDSSETDIEPVYDNNNNDKCTFT